MREKLTRTFPIPTVDIIIKSIYLFAITMMSNVPTCCQVELVLGLEDRFRWLTRLFNVAQGKQKPLKVHPNKKKIQRLMAPVLRLLRGKDYCSAEHISHVLNPTKVNFRVINYWCSLLPRRLEREGRECLSHFVCVYV